MLICKVLYVWENHNFTLLSPLKRHLQIKYYLCLEFQYPVMVPASTKVKNGHHSKTVFLFSFFKVVLLVLIRLKFSFLILTERQRLQGLIETVGILGKSA